VGSTTDLAPSGRGPLARHAVEGPRHPILRLVAVVGVTLAVLAVSVTGVAAFAVWDAGRAIADTAVDIGTDLEGLPPTIGEIEGGVNILMVGTDSCEGQDVALFPRCAEDEGGERNDVTMLVHVSDNPRRATVVSFPRDMYVDIPECTGPDGTSYAPLYSEKINESYGRGGMSCTVQTVEAVTGESIDFAAAVRWTGVINMSDAIGGVDVCVEGQIDDGHTGLHLAAGTHTLVGAEALQFLRIRHGIGDGSDLGRISNQQQFMSSMVRKMQSDAVLTNPTTLFRFATTAMQQVNQGQLLLSRSLANPTRMVQIAMALKDIPFQDFVFVQYPTAYGDGGVVPVTSAAEELFAALRANQALTLTGEASQGMGVDVVGEAAPLPSASAPPVDGAAAPAEPATPIDPSAAAELPSAIAGQTAAQVTCTRPQE
jgi:LCP family protein required for cell wall assembly